MTKTPPMYKSSVTPKPPFMTIAPVVLEVDCVVVNAAMTPPTYSCLATPIPPADFIVPVVVDVLGVTDK